MNQPRWSVRRFGLLSTALLSFLLASETYAGGACETDEDCDDGLHCTYDRCDGPEGCFHAPWPCGDADPCTDDGCVEPTGCEYTPNSIACDDGSACTSADACSNGACTGTPNSDACSDGNACTVNDVCQSGSCTGVPANCNDSNLCTNDFCHPASGCQHNARGCDDSNQCTNDGCTPSTGLCNFTNAPSGQSCYNGAQGCRGPDSCDGAGHCVDGAPISCDDHDPCTFDFCFMNVFCRHNRLSEGSACNDGNACTIQDQCRFGTCSGSPIGFTCNDGIECTQDYYCNPATGSCEYPQMPACSSCNGGNGTCDVSGVCRPVSPTNDADGDGRPSGCDCLPADPTAWAIPPEVMGLAVNRTVSADIVSWTDAAPFAGSGTTHDVIRGYLDELPVGGVPVETCLVWGTGDADYPDADLPQASLGFWYLVRAKNACGQGTYGTSDLGVRQSGACP